MLEGPNYLSYAVVMATELLLDALLLLRLKLGGVMECELTEIEEYFDMGVI
jgi:hypothetical protein